MPGQIKYSSDVSCDAVGSCHHDRIDRKKILRRLLLLANANEIFVHRCYKYTSVPPAKAAASRSPRQLELAELAELAELRQPVPTYLAFAASLGELRQSVFCVHKRTS